MSYWGGNWDPLNWPSDISKTFMNELENGLSYLFSQILNSLLGLYSSMLGIAMQLFNSFLTAIVNSAISLGPLSLPVFVLGTVLLLCGAFLAFLVAKDTPVIGAFT